MAGKRKCPECGMKTLWVSWSSLKTHETCRMRGQLQRAGKKGVLQNTRVFFPGTVVDRVVRDWLIGDPEKNLGLMPSMVEAIMDREKIQIEDSGGSMQWKNKDDHDEVLKDCVEAVTKIEHSLIQEVLPYDWQADARFKAPLLLPHPDGGTEQIILNGAMDILVRDDKGLFRVWDVKMTRNEDYWRQTAGQLTFYDTAITIMFGEASVKAGLLQPMCKEQVKPYPITDDLRAQMMSRMVRMADDIWRQDTPPRADSIECAYCNVKHACSKFTPVVIEGKRRLAF